MDLEDTSLPERIGDYQRLRRIGRGDWPEFRAKIQPPVRPTERSDVPEPLERLRVSGLEPEPTKRLASAKDALLMLESWLGYRNPYLIDAFGEPLRVAYDAKLDPSLPHLDRLTTLAEHCLTTLAQRVPLPRSVSLPLLLSLPEPRPGFTAADEQHMERHLAQTKSGLRVRSVRTVARGHAGGLQSAPPRLPVGRHFARGSLHRRRNRQLPRSSAWLTKHIKDAGTAMGVTIKVIRV